MFDRVENELLKLSYWYGLHNTPDGDCTCHEKAPKPGPHELELMSRQDRSPKRRKLMAEFFRAVAKQITAFEKDVLSIWGLPDIDIVRQAAIQGVDPDDEEPWKYPTGAYNLYKHRVVELGYEILGRDLFDEIKAVGEKQANLIEGTYPYYEFNAFTIGVDETIDQMLQDIDPVLVNPDELNKRRAKITRENPYYTQTVKQGGKRIKTSLATDYMDDVMQALKRMSKNGKGPIAAGRELHDLVGEGKLWYWMRITRSESVLGINAGFNYLQEKYQVPYQRWSAGPGACEVCTYFGRQGMNIWPRGEGPEPVTSSHPHCLCALESVWVTKETPQPAWGRPNPYDQPYTAREREGMAIMNEAQEEYRRMKR